jgi:hypothetical protein
VKAGQNNYRIVKHKVEDAIWKLAQQSPAHVLVNNRIKVGIPPNGFKASLKRSDELILEAGAGEAIPFDSVFDVLFGIAADEKLICGH